MVRFIAILLILTPTFSFSSNHFECDEGFQRTEYQLKNVEVIACNCNCNCNCNCTIQDNIFYVKTDSYYSYLVKGASVFVDGEQAENAQLNHHTATTPLVASYLKNSKLCNSESEFISNNLYFFTQIPDSNSYCYIPSAIMENKIVTTLSDEVSVVAYGTIQLEKQYLYHSPAFSSKTRMYLIQEDKVEVLKEKEDWLYILYRGKKEVRKWIPKKAIIKNNINSLKELL